jgi:hypothetical protein
MAATQPEASSLGVACGLFDETEVKCDHKKNYMNNGARATKFWRLAQIGAYQWHGHTGEIQIKLDSTADDERACQEFATFGTPNSTNNCPSSDHDDRRRSQNHNHSGLAHGENPSCHHDKQSAAANRPAVHLVT